MFKDEDLKVFEKPSEQIVSRYLSLFGFKDDQCQVGKKGCHIHTLHSETSEILVSREFSRIFFHFHFSFSISSRFNFTFTSQKKVKGFHFSLFTSRKK